MGGGGRFREDLYARINMWRFALPAWRSGGKILRRTWSMNYGDWPTERQTQIRFDKDARERYLALPVRRRR